MCSVMKKYICKSLVLVFSLYISLGCFAQLDKEITLLHTSDTHSRLEPISSKDDFSYNKGGFVRRATFVKKLREEGQNVLLLDCGDFSQGTPYYNLFKGEAEVKMMNEMGYDALTIGNHEFDLGLENMARLFKMAKFPIVCANYDVSHTILKKIVKPYIILDRFDIKIGIFGLGIKLDGLVQKDKCKGIIYKDPVLMANKVAALLKDKGCDLVICLSHLGVESDRLVLEQTKNIDVILGGHSHTLMEKPKTYLNKVGESVVLMHSGSKGTNIGRIDLILKHK